MGRKRGHRKRKPGPTVLYVAPRPPFQDNHTRKLLAMLASGELKPTPGEFRNVHVAHDDWCALLKGIGPCNCDPDIYLGAE